MGAQGALQGDPAAPDVVVVSDLLLMAECVAGALRRYALRAAVLPWDGGPAPSVSLAGVGDGAPPSGPARPDVALTALDTWATGARRPVALVLSDLEPWSRQHAVRRLLRGVPGLAWVVATPTPEGLPWGGVLAAGAVTVVPAHLDLENLASVVARVRLRDAPVPANRAALVSGWQEAAEVRRARAQRLLSLSPREREVLAMLYQGRSSEAVAEEYGVSHTTVRSHVRAVLRKLQVSTQLAAVAAYADFAESGERPVLAGLSEALTPEPGVERRPVVPRLRPPPRRWAPPRARRPG